MPFSSGTFSLFTPGNPVVTGTTIASTWANNTFNDIATALSTCVLKDGSQTITANIPMGSFKFTGLAAGTASGNSLRFEQLFTTGAVNLLGPINEVKTTVVSATTPDIWTSVGNVVDYTGTATMTGFAAAPQAGSRRYLICAGAAVFTAGANVLFQGVPSGSTYTATAGDVVEVIAVTTTQFRLALLPVTGIPGKQQTRQILTSGSSATYTTPSGATRIIVRMVGGGGGGGAAVTNSGTAGGNTTFSTLTAGGGGGGGAAGTSSAGGTATGGDINAPGAPGGSGGNNLNTIVIGGGHGGSSYFGGGGAGGFGGAGAAAAANSGGGGGGGGTSSSQCGGGGASGAYCEKLITAPSATYTYTIGAIGTGGAAGGLAGGNGGTGLIVVDEFYN